MDGNRDLIILIQNKPMTTLYTWLWIEAMALPSKLNWAGGPNKRPAFPSSFELGFYSWGIVGRVSCIVYIPCGSLAAAILPCIRRSTFVLSSQSLERLELISILSDTTSGNEASEEDAKDWHHCRCEIPLRSSSADRPRLARKTWGWLHTTL